jgi:hypothetical protein
MVQAGSSRGINFAYDRTSKALDDQLDWIDKLDTKAGVLLAADGVIAGLVMTKDSVLLTIPNYPAMLVVGLLILSLVLALLAFATRHYEIAPEIDSLLQQMPNSDDELLKSAALPSLVNALDINEPKVNQKATMLYYSALALLGGIFLFATHFMYFVIDP